MDEENIYDLPELEAEALFTDTPLPQDTGLDDDIYNLPEDTALDDIIISRADAIGSSTPGPIQNVGQYVPDDFGKYKQDYNITLPGQLDDPGEYRGATQSNLDKWTNGSIKFVGKTGVNVAGSIPGLGYGCICRYKRW
jgi:hypothetical protein